MKPVHNIVSQPFVAGFSNLEVEKKREKAWEKTKPEQTGRFSFMKFRRKLKKSFKVIRFCSFSETVLQNTKKMRKTPKKILKETTKSGEKLFYFLETLSWENA